MSVQGVQLSAGTGQGWMCLALAKPLAHFNVRAANALTEKCMFLDVPTMPLVKDEAFLSFLYFAGGATVASSTISGGLRFNWGYS
jgi:hypothetical protein